MMPPLPDPTAHGTMRGYARGCRCTRCKVANSDRVKRQRTGQARRPALVSAEAARAHLLHLQAHQMGAWHIARLSGLSSALIRKVRSGALTRIKPATAAALLAVPIKPALGTRLSAAETWRRIRTLLAERYTRRELAIKLGYKSKLPFLKGEGAKVTLRTALKVRRLYRTLEGGEDQTTTGEPDGE